jgi:hypothetical protein
VKDAKKFVETTVLRRATKKLIDALFGERWCGPPVLPTSGSVRSPDGVVHEIVGDLTWCEQTWASVRDARRPLAEVEAGWVLDASPVTCMQCLGDGRFEDLR